MEAMERSGPEPRAEEQAPHASAARTVTLFEDRAEVVRVATVRATAGARWAAIGGVSLYVDERTVQARVLGPGRDGDGTRITASRVRWRAHRDAALGREEIDALAAEERDAAERVAAAELAIDRAARREVQAGQLLWKWADALSKAPRKARMAEALATWRDGLRALDTAAADALRAASEAGGDRARALDDQARAAARLREGSIEKPRFEAVIEVEIQTPAGAAPRDVEVELTYRVACALWRPEHLARLLASGDSVDLVTWATAWQATGETWDHITARFSTARPARSATPPRISDDVLKMRRKTAEERSRVVVEAREQAIAAAGLGRGARAVDEMPGVDDGGEPVVFQAPHPVSIPSDGRPLRVEVVRRKLKAEIALVLYPEANPAAHSRATMTLSPDGPLLAGPIRIARGQSLVGRSRVDFVGVGEPFEIGFGADDAVRVRRTVEEERDTAAITGTRKIRRKVKVHLSNLSGEPRRLVVAERIPVSEVAEVEIALGDAAGWTLDGKDGFVRSRVDLGPNETRTVSFGYEIRASSSVVLPF